MAEKLWENAAPVNLVKILYDSLGSIRSNYKVSLYVHAN
jgi:hypothetical protein